MPQYDLTGPASLICHAILEEYQYVEWQKTLPPYLSNQGEDIDWLIEQMAYEWVVDDMGEIVRRRTTGQAPPQGGKP